MHIFIGETIGISLTIALESGIFLACIPVVSLIASTLILKKKPTRQQVMGTLITLAGVIITVLAVGISSSLSPAGYGFLLIGVISNALYTVFVDRASDYSGAEILAVGVAAFVTLGLIESLLQGTVYELVTLPFHDTNFLTAIMYQGIGCSVVAFFLSNVTIAKIGVNRTSSFIGVATVVSIVASGLLFWETFTIGQIIGAAISIAGVYAANARPGHSHS